MEIVYKNGRLEPGGHGPKRFGGICDGQAADDAVTMKQLSTLGGVIVEQTGAFINIDPDRAFKIETPSGTVYIPILIAP